jgi:hypothetical protein
VQDCAVRRRDLLTEARETYMTKDSGICRRQSGSSRLCLPSARAFSLKPTLLSALPGYRHVFPCVSMSFSVSPSDPAFSSPWLRTCVGREILIPKSCKRSWRLLKTQSGVFRSACVWRKEKSRAHKWIHNMHTQILILSLSHTQTLAQCAHAHSTAPPQIRPTL